MKKIIVLLALIATQFCGTEVSQSQFIENGFNWILFGQNQEVFATFKERKPSTTTLELAPLKSNKIKEESLNLPYVLALSSLNSAHFIIPFGHHSRYIEISTPTKDPQKVLTDYFGPLLNADAIQSRKKRKERESHIQSLQKRSLNGKELAEAQSLLNLKLSHCMDDDFYVKFYEGEENQAQYKLRSLELDRDRKISLIKSSYSNTSRVEQLEDEYSKLVIEESNLEYELDYLTRLKEENSMDYRNVKNKLQKNRAQQVKILENIKAIRKESSEAIRKEEKRYKQSSEPYEEAILAIQREKRLKMAERDKRATSLNRDLQKIYKEQKNNKNDSLGEKIFDALTQTHYSSSEIQCALKSYHSAYLNLFKKEAESLERQENLSRGYVNKIRNPNSQFWGTYLSLFENSRTKVSLEQMEDIKTFFEIITENPNHFNIIHPASHSWSLF